MNKYIVALCLCLLVFSHAHAQPNYKVQEATLRHDVGAWLLPQHHLPLVSVRLSIDYAGTAYDPEGKAGLAALVGKLLMRGPKRMEHQEFHQWMERRGVKLSIGAGRERMSIHLQSLKKYLPEALKMLGDILDQDQFDAKAVATVKAETSAHLKRLESMPWYHASRGFAQQVYGEHAYGAFSLGTQESVARITPHDIARYMQRLYQPDHWTVAVVGDVTAAQFTAMSEALFGQWSGVVAAPDVTARKPMHALPTKAQKTHENAGSAKSMVMMAWPAPARTSDEFMPAYILNYMLGGGGLTSQLMLDLRDKRGLIYGGSSELDLWPSSNLWTVQYSTRPEQVSEAMNATTALLRHMAKGELDAGLFARSKAEITGGFALQTDSMGKLSNYLMVMQFFDLGLDYLNIRNQKFEAVTVQQVQAVAKKWLSHAPVVMFSYGQQVKAAQ